MRKLAGLCLLAILLGLLPAFGFDYARYEPTDLDALLTQNRPRAGFDTFPARAVKLEVTLAAYAEPCQTGLLSRVMTMVGVTVNAQISRCIKVRSAKGAQLSVFIQDQVSDFLPKEVPLGHRLTLFAVHLYATPEGPGLLVNEFKSEADDAAKSAAAPSCGCGSPDFHPGLDLTNDVAGAPVRPAADGVVVKVEADENAAVAVPSIGRCGRYIVIKHSYPDGRVVFTRYAQLGRVVGADGQPLAAGAKVTKADKIGEVGSKKVLHFEVRPADADSMEKGAAWIAQYGVDPAMEWSRYQPVDPQTFDFGKLGEAGSK
jgi:hypothetical protein